MFILQVLKSAQSTSATPSLQIQCVIPTGLTPHSVQISQVLLTLTPVIVAVCIAYFSFEATRNKEHRQWVRDQKKSEWKDVLTQLASIENNIPVLVTGIPEHKTLENDVLNILPLLRSTVFVYPVLVSSGFLGEWQEFLGYVSGSFKRVISTNLAVQKGMVDPVTIDDRIKWSDQSARVEVEIRQRFYRLLERLREVAHKDMEFDPKA